MLNRETFFVQPWIVSCGSDAVGVGDANVYLSATVHFEGGGLALAVCNLLLSRGR